MNTLLLDCLNGKKTPRPPLWLMRQAGRYLPEYRALRAQHRDFLEMCKNPKVCTELTLQPLRRYPLDAGIVFSDILVVPEALGQRVWFEAGEGPKLGELKFEQLEFEEKDFLQKLEPVYEAIESIRAAASNTPLIGFAGSPWTLATYMIEGGSSKTFSRALSLAYGKAEYFQKFLSVLETAVTAHLSAQIKHGAQVVQLFDSWAGAVPIPLFEQLILNPTKRIIARLRQQHPHIPIIGFAKGTGTRIIQYAGCGMQGVGIDQYTNPLTVHQARLKVATQGNIDPFLLVEGGKRLEDYTHSLLEDVKPYPHILNLGHGILPNTPPEHVEMLCQLVAKS